MDNTIEITDKSQSLLNINTFYENIIEHNRWFYPKSFIIASSFSTDMYKKMISNLGTIQSDKDILDYITSMDNKQANKIYKEENEDDDDVEEKEEKEEKDDDDDGLDFELQFDTNEDNDEETKEEDEQGYIPREFRKQKVVPLNPQQEEYSARINELRYYETRERVIECYKQIIYEYTKINPDFKYELESTKNDFILYINDMENKSENKFCVNMEKYKYYDEKLKQIKQEMNQYEMLYQKHDNLQKKFNNVFNRMIYEIDNWYGFALMKARDMIKSKNIDEKNELVDKKQIERNIFLFELFKQNITTNIDTNVYTILINVHKTLITTIIKTRLYLKTKNILEWIILYQENISEELETKLNYLYKKEDNWDIEKVKYYYSIINVDNIEEYSNESHDYFSYYNNLYDNISNDEQVNILLDDITITLDQSWFENKLNVYKFNHTTSYFLKYNKKGEVLIVPFNAGVNLIDDGELQQKIKNGTEIKFKHNGDTYIKINTYKYNNDYKYFTDLIIFGNLEYNKIKELTIFYETYKLLSDTHLDIQKFLKNQYNWNIVVEYLTNIYSKKKYLKNLRSYNPNFIYDKKDFKEKIETLALNCISLYSTSNDNIEELTNEYNKKINQLKQNYENILMKKNEFISSLSVFEPYKQNLITIKFSNTDNILNPYFNFGETLITLNVYNKNAYISTLRDAFDEFMFFKELSKVISYKIRSSENSDEFMDENDNYQHLITSIDEKYYCMENFTKNQNVKFGSMLIMFDAFKKYYKNMMSISSFIKELLNTGTKYIVYNIFDSIEENIAGKFFMELRDSYRLHSVPSYLDMPQETQFEVNDVALKYYKKFAINELMMIINTVKIMDAWSASQGYDITNKLSIDKINFVKNILFNHIPIIEENKLYLDKFISQNKISSLIDDNGYSIFVYDIPVIQNYIYSKIFYIHELRHMKEISFEQFNSYLYNHIDQYIPFIKDNENIDNEVNACVQAVLHLIRVSQKLVPKSTLSIQNINFVIDMLFFEYETSSINKKFNKKVEEYNKDGVKMYFTIMNEFKQYFVDADRDAIIKFNILIDFLKSNFNKFKTMIVKYANAYGNVIPDIVLENTQNLAENKLMDKIRSKMNLPTPASPHYKFYFIRTNDISSVYTVKIITEDEPSFDEKGKAYKLKYPVLTLVPKNSEQAKLILQSVLNKQAILKPKIIRKRTTKKIVPTKSNVSKVPKTKVSSSKKIARGL